jgi:nucleoside-diphosphate-sugar epimerase
MSGELAGWEIRGVDLPECDVRDYDSADGVLRAHAVVHLAWDATENFLPASLEPDDHPMAHNVCAGGVGRVIAASSVRADRFWPPREGLRRIDDPPVPDSPYGASKVFLEALGRPAAHLGHGRAGDDRAACRARWTPWARMG